MDNKDLKNKIKKIVDDQTKVSEETFINEICELSEHYSKKQLQKEKLIRMMQYDEELGLYQELQEDDDTINKQILSDARTEAYIRSLKKGYYEKLPQIGKDVYNLLGGIIIGILLTYLF